MAVTLTLDLRAQVIANVKVAIPHLLPNERTPDGTEMKQFDVILKANKSIVDGKTTYEAFPLYGPDMQTFAESLPC